MIVCPVCQVKLHKRETRLVCPRCAFQPTEIEGILCFAPGETGENFADYNARGLDLLHKYEQDHFWFKNRRRVIRRIFKKYVKKNERIIEIGAGTGNVSQMLTRQGYKPELGEIHIKGLQYAQKKGMNRLYQFDTGKAPFKDEYDTVAMFDVLEHIEDDGLVLRNVNRVLKKGGKLILTVPAHQFLWSAIDVASGHKRRYGMKELKKILVDNGFEILESRFFFIFLLPFFLVRKLLNRKHGQSLSDGRTGMKVNGVVNCIFNVFLVLEYYFLYWNSPHFGGSIITAARKI